MQAGLVVAAVGSAETLVCATATDQLHRGARTKYNQELFAQGVGNTLCGLLGALPLTGVIVRSSANIEAGGQTRLSSVLHGAWLLLFIAAFAWMLNAIPTSALAAILVYTGYKLMDPQSVRELSKFGRSEVAIFAATVITIVVFGLLAGVITGFALAIAKLLHSLSRLNAVLKLMPTSDSAHLVLSGSATFLGLPRLAAKLEEVPPGAKLRVHFRALDYIDHACVDLLQNWADQHKSTGGEMHIDWASLQAKHDQELPTEEDAVRKTVENVKKAV